MVALDFELEWADSATPGFVALESAVGRPTAVAALVVSHSSRDHGPAKNPTLNYGTANKRQRLTEITALQHITKTGWVSYAESPDRASANPQVRDLATWWANKSVPATED